jgi:hypothetical protein
MAAKLLISAPSNSGKTTLLKDLEDALVISIDGKKFPYAIPHVNVDTFDSIDEFTDLISSKVQAYNEKFGKYPKTIAIDSVSRVFETAANNCNSKYNGFQVYSELNKEIAAFTAYLESVVGSGTNLVIISHSVYDPDTGRYKLVDQGSFGKAGGFLSVVDNAVALEVKSNKRIVHHRSPKMAARTILTPEELPDQVLMDEYNLQNHINLLENKQDEVEEFIL